jgi:hypothetical protein
MTNLPVSRLFDDASQFPPNNLDLDTAVEEHRAWREGERADLVGRFLIPLGRLEALAADRDWQLGIIVPADATPASARNAAAAVGGTPAVVTAVELSAAADRTAIAAWREAFPDADLFLEGRAEAVDAIRGMGAKAKVRCGGATAAAVPEPHDLAAFIAACAALEVPFKATAGLHQPLRHYDEGLRCHQYGFLNLWAATALALERPSTDLLLRALVAEDLESLRIDELDLTAARERFEAFGTCSIEEPIAALVGLGLLAHPPEPPTLPRATTRSP